MHPENFATDFWKRLTRWPLLCALLGVVLVSNALATDALYENDTPQVFTVTPNNAAPQIHATNFVNNNSFEVDFSSTTINPELFETWGTLNYTNNGLMVANSALGIDDIFLSLSPGCGFQFDTQTTNVIPRTMATSFYNPGTIRCNSEIDNLDNFLFLFTVGECVVSATNVVSPGTIDVGADGLVRLTGNKVDLTRGTLTLENSGTVESLSAAVGGETNEIDPPANFSLPDPFSPLLFLQNATAYVSDSGIVGSNREVRAVFISNPIASVTNYVSFDFGDIIVEWDGTYIDPIAKTLSTNYLYFEDFFGEITNLQVVGGVPVGYEFFEGGPQNIGNHAPSTLAPANSFIEGDITNKFAYYNVDLIPTSAPTNTPSQNVTNYLAILPGRAQITANQELDLSLASISGPNYLSINSPNQFDGSTGAQIFSPYSDVSLGVTNGFLTVTNLLEPITPAWNGSIVAYSARWSTVDTNGITNSFHVLLINSGVSPTTPSEVQDLKLHATNSIIISDTLNILRTLSIDAQSLTLTTNGPAAASADGELNLQSSSTLFQSALPNLLCLTNNGAIRTLSQAQFISNSNTVSVTPGTPTLAATATLSEMGGINPVKNATVTIGTKKYAFESTLTNATANQVKIATTFDGSMSNLIAAINGTTGAGANYSSATIASTQIVAGTLSIHVGAKTNYFIVTAITAGSAGNLIAIATSATNLTWNGQPHLTGGADAVAAITNVSSSQVPYTAIVNNSLISDQGSMIWVNDFENYGAFSNGVGSFVLQSSTTTLTNGSITAGGDVSITTGSLLASNVMIQAARSLTLTVTNLLTDTGVTNGNIWTVGLNSVGVGLNLSMLPTNANRGDLLGTTITNYAPADRNVINTWAGKDFGANTAGYTNNVAVGRLILDSLAGPSTAPPHTLFTFNGAGVSNAIYVDYLEFDDYATNRDSGGNVSSLAFNSNLVIYYAQAVINGFSVAQKLDGKNNGHLRWVPTYAGYFSSTNLVYPDGSTNTFNVALAQNPQIDSDGDGTPNSTDTTPFFVPSEVNLTATVTNLPPLSVNLTWDTVPLATNCVLYTTNVLMTNWMILTNFISPIAYPSPPTNVTVFDSLTSPPRYYKVRVSPWLTYPF